MNKKKRNTRIKHRKNQKRVKKLLQISLEKAKPKKIVKKVESKEKTIKNNKAESTVEKKVATKKATTKKATTKKAETKKTEKDKD